MPQLRRPGRAQVDTVHNARGMIQNRHAIAFMGNHEFNAVA
jgi:hypothetical protein